VDFIVIHRLLKKRTKQRDFFKRLKGDSRGRTRRDSESVALSDWATSSCEVYSNL